MGLQKRLGIALVLSGILCLAAASCSGGKLSELQRRDTEQPAALLNPRLAALAAPGAELEPVKLSLHERHEQDGIVVLELQSRDPASIAEQYFSICYDAAAFSFLGAADPLPEDSGPLFYCVEAGAGELHCGMLRMPGADEGEVAAETVLASLLFRPGSSPVARTAAADAPEALNTFIAQLGFLNIDKESGLVSVRYRTPYRDMRGIVPGDYNLDKHVSIHDMGLIGQHWGWRSQEKAREIYQALPPDASQDEKDAISNTTLNEDLIRLDGDRNGVVGPGDLVLIGRYFGNRLEGFKLYADKKQGNAFPETVDAPSSIEPVLTLDQTAFVPSGELTSMVEQFEATLPQVDPDAFYFARAVISGREYSASNPCYDISMAYDPNYVLAYDRGAGQLSWYYSFWGDLNQDDRVNANDFVPIGQHLGEIVPFNRSSDMWMLDSIRNGVISAVEAFAIEQSFLISYEGTRVYATLDPAEVPADPREPSSLAPILDSSTGQAWNLELSQEEGQRRQYSADLAIPEGSYVWVRQVYFVDRGKPGIYEGARSEVIQVE